VSRGRLGKAPTINIRRDINATDPDYELLHTDTIHKVLKVRTGPIPTHEPLNARASQAGFESTAAQLGATAAASEPSAKLRAHASSFYHGRHEWRYVWWSLHLGLNLTGVLTPCDLRRFETPLTPVPRAPRADDAPGHTRLHPESTADPWPASLSPPTQVSRWTEVLPFLELLSLPLSPTDIWGADGAAAAVLAR
jgi:hypothetical protein